MTIKYNMEDRFFEYWDGDKCVSQTHIDKVHKQYFCGENICDWDVVRRMALRNNQDKVEVWTYNPWTRRRFLYSHLYAEKIDGRIQQIQTGETGF